MPESSNIISSIARSSLVFRDPAGTEVELTVRPMRTARRLRLRVDTVRGRVVLTLPHHHSRRAAFAWAEARRPWVEEMLARRPAARPFAPGAQIPFDDGMLTLDWRPERPRAAQRDGDTLLCGGPLDRLGPNVEAWLKREALRLLSEDTRHFAKAAGVAVSRVSVRDPRSRWGSCSAGGSIAYSWRLALAPRFVRRATAAHEVAHRLHMDHSPAFHAAFQGLLGCDPAPARDWLRRNGAELHLFGR